jgi:hypothetical protein
MAVLSGGCELVSVCRQNAALCGNAVTCGARLLQHRPTSAAAERHGARTTGSYGPLASVQARRREGRRAGTLQCSCHKGWPALFGWTDARAGLQVANVLSASVSAIPKSRRGPLGDPDVYPNLSLLRLPCSNLSIFASASSALRHLFLASAMPTGHDGCHADHFLGLPGRHSAGSRSPGFQLLSNQGSSGP